MNKDELKTMLEQHRLWLEDNNSGKRANLQYADLEGADLQYASLQYANLQYADLQYADLEGADLRYASLQYADMRGANLQYADLQYADLEGADLRYADLDYSSLPLWCGSKGMIVDRLIAAQIAAHFCALECDDADYIAARKAILEFASTSHRAMDLGLLGEIVKECNDVATPIDVALRKRIAELETERRWIPVSERMPDDWESVLTIDISKSTQDVVSAFYNPETSLWSTHFSCDLWVTHWMPLPEPPILYGKVCEE